MQRPKFLLLLLRTCYSLFLRIRVCDPTIKNMSFCSSVKNQNLRSSVESVSLACHWKFFTKLYFRINPAGKSKVPSWKIFISQLENNFFPVRKSKFRSRAILGDFLGLFLNYFKRFLFILTLMYTLWTKVKMFDSEPWAMSDELRVMSFRLDRRTKGHVFYCRVTDPYPQKQRITYSQ